MKCHLSSACAESISSKAFHQLSSANCCETLRKLVTQNLKIILQKYLKVLTNTLAKYWHCYYLNNEFEKYPHTGLVISEQPFPPSWHWITQLEHLEPVSEVRYVPKVNLTRPHLKEFNPLVPVCFPMITTNQKLFVYTSHLVNGCPALTYIIRVNT